MINYTKVKKKKMLTQPFNGLNFDIIGILFDLFTVSVRLLGCVTDLNRHGSILKVSVAFVF